MFWRTFRKVVPRRTDPPVSHSAPPRPANGMSGAAAVLVSRSAVRGSAPTRQWYVRVFCFDKLLDWNTHDIRFQAIGDLHSHAAGQITLERPTFQIFSKAGRGGANSDQVVGSGKAIKTGQTNSFFIGSPLKLRLLTASGRTVAKATQRGHCCSSCLAFELWAVSCDER